LTYQQDRSPTNSYNGLIYFLIAIKSVEVLLGPVYDYLDGKWLAHSLRMNEAKRVAFRNRAIEENLDVKGWRVERKVLLVVLGQLSAMIVVAWVVSAVACPFGESTLMTAVHHIFARYLVVMVVQCPECNVCPQIPRIRNTMHDAMKRLLRDLPCVVATIGICRYHFRSETSGSGSIHPDGSNRFHHVIGRVVPCDATFPQNMTNCRRPRLTRIDASMSTRCDGT
jgi:hypothetical protein